MMKKIIIFLLFAIPFLNISCEDNFDPKIYGTLSTTNFPLTEQDYESYMMTCYLPFSVNWIYQLSSWQHNFYVPEGGFMRLFDATSDYCAPWRVASWGGAWMHFTEAFFDNAIYYGRDSGAEPSHFEKVRDITRFTEIIGVLEGSTALSEQKKKNLIGEARFLRGMTMYYLLHIYGPVPVIIDSELVGNEEAEMEMVRPTLTQMTEWISSDLEYGVDNMPKTAAKGRYTSDYARFCLMKHYLNEGAYMADYYDKAIALYEQLKTSGYSLFTSGENPYTEQFKIANKFNNEVIMAVSCTETGDGSGVGGNFNPLTWYVIPDDASRYVDIENTIPTPFVYQGGGWGQTMNISNEYYLTYEEDDLRKEVILTSYVQNNQERTVVTKDDIGVKWSGFILNKYPVETDNQFQPTDIPLARWADVLLMYAEAVARKTQAVPTGEAMLGVNEVRSRAGLPPLSGEAVSSYDAFMNALLKERGHEFLYEGFRKIDLIRFNKYRHNVKAIKGQEPTHQYIPLPNFAVQQAETYGLNLEQYYERPDYYLDN